MYNAITRPRSDGSVVVCTYPFAVVSVVTTQKPVSTNVAAYVA